MDNSQGSASWAASDLFEENELLLSPFAPNKFGQKAPRKKNMLWLNAVEQSFSSDSSNCHGKHVAAVSHMSAPPSGKQRHTVHISHHTRQRPCDRSWGLDAPALADRRKGVRGREQTNTVDVRCYDDAHAKSRGGYWPWLSFKVKCMHKVIFWVRTRRCRAIALRCYLNFTC